ncbi:MAG: 2-C-methyl-D-erythritol 4-phosphate cytidylyltransferase [Coriobacteriia bacterium]|nr:2-C-methyl-D-erythritol 4-phosphate cytidylyltransferase [Coriobacteriia bacterium]
MNVAVIVAGGSGERSGLDGGKQLATVAGGPVLSHTLAAFHACESVDAIVVVVHPERVDEYRAQAVDPLASPKVFAVVGGGPTRQMSVSAGLAVVPDAARVIAIHDGARPLVDADVLAAAIRALASDDTIDGVVVGHPSYDTLKLVDESGRVIGTVDRTAFWAAQTPQVFRAPALREAYARAEALGLEGTDDASLVEAAGGRVRMLEGPRDNIKVTVPGDLPIVEQILKARAGGSGA